MQRYLALLMLALAAVVNAHFQLQYPPPRGVFVEDNEPTFCDGYNTPASNRSIFPLTGGFFTMNSEHPQWTAGVIIATTQDPTSFNNFTQAKPFFQETGEGIFCIPLNFADNSNTTSLQDGQNITIQIVFDGGDGNLYQCADLTLSSSFTIPSNVTCSNATASSTTGSTGTSTGAPASTTSKSAALGKTVSAAITGLVFSICGVAMMAF